jgi:hypothetical protein
LSRFDLDEQPSTHPEARSGDVERPPSLESSAPHLLADIPD